MGKRNSYKAPAGELGRYWFWSSSSFDVHPAWDYILNGDSGGFYVVMDTTFGNTEVYYAVRCVNR